jgi:hypothetical protein
LFDGELVEFFFALLHPTPRIGTILLLAIVVNWHQLKAYDGISWSEQVSNFRSFSLHLYSKVAGLNQKSR